MQRLGGTFLPVFFLTKNNLNNFIAELTEIRESIETVGMVPAAKQKYRKIKIMKDKATHYGTCQLCGSFQKLPGGVLASHGYNITWGSFVGTCHGSGRAPFEQSKDYVEAEIANGQRILANLAPVEHPGYMVVSRMPQFLSDEDKVKKAAWEQYCDIKGSWERFIAYQVPRCAKWEPKELTPVVEEEARRDASKKSVKGIRELARMRDLTKRELIKAVEQIEKAVCCWPALSYPTTANAHKYANLARSAGKVELADDVTNKLAAFKAAKANYDAAKSGAPVVASSL